MNWAIRFWRASSSLQLMGLRRTRRHCDSNYNYQQTWWPISRQKKICLHALPNTKLFLRRTPSSRSHTSTLWVMWPRRHSAWGLTGTTNTLLLARGMDQSIFTMSSLANAVTPLTITWLSPCLRQLSGKQNVNFRWRPLNAPGVTKNVIISTNADGGLYHWHTTSNKQLNKIYDAYS